MLTGTIIWDLMASVERAEQSAQQKKVADEMELQRMYALHMPSARLSQVNLEPTRTQAYAGAA